LSRDELRYSTVLDNICASDFRECCLKFVVIGRRGHETIRYLDIQALAELGRLFLLDVKIRCG